MIWIGLFSSSPSDDHIYFFPIDSWITDYYYWWCSLYLGHGAIGKYHLILTLCFIHCVYVFRISEAGSGPNVFIKVPITVKNKNAAWYETLWYSQAKSHCLLNVSLDLCVWNRCAWSKACVCEHVKQLFM